MNRTSNLKKRCLYQFERHDRFVCSEAENRRACAYPGFWCDCKEQTKQRLWREYS